MGFELTELVTPNGDIKFDRHGHSDCEKKESGGNEPMLAYRKWTIDINVKAISQEVPKPQPITEIEAVLFNLWPLTPTPEIPVPCNIVT